MELDLAGGPVRVNRSNISAGNTSELPKTVVKAQGKRTARNDPLLDRQIFRRHGPVVVRCSECSFSYRNVFLGSPRPAKIPYEVWTIEIATARAATITDKGIKIIF